MEVTKLGSVRKDNNSNDFKLERHSLSSTYRSSRRKARIRQLSKPFICDQRSNFSKRLIPILLTLQITGFYPATSFKRLGLRILHDIFRQRQLYIGLLAAAAIVFNCYMFHYNVDGMAQMANQGNSSFTEILLDPMFVSIMINCQKPLISLVNLLVFIVGFKKHKKLLQTLDVVDKALHDNFGCDPHIERWNVIFVLVVLITFLVPMSLRIVQTVLMSEELGANWLVDLSFVLVPLWALWMTLPLFYFETISRVIRFWCSELRKLIVENYLLSFEQRPLKLYYMKFVEIVKAQVAMQQFFAPFMLWSLIWSVFTLALSIYFATQTETLLPPDLPPEFVMVMLFVIGWSGIQVGTGIIYILLITVSGTATNEAVSFIKSKVKSNFNDQSGPVKNQPSV